MVLVPVDLKGPNDEIVEIVGVEANRKFCQFKRKNAFRDREKGKRNVLKEKAEGEGKGQSSSELKIEPEKEEISDDRELMISLGFCKTECRHCSNPH